MASTNNVGFSLLIKLLIIGDQAVGKSSLMTRFTDNSFTDSYVATIGIDFKIRTIELNRKRVRLQIWDTAGQERFRTITSAYYRGAMGALIVYDITNELSFKNVHHWLKHLDEFAQKDICKILVGTKDDKTEERTIPIERGEALAKQFNLKLFETSAKSGHNIENLFFELARDVIANLLISKDTTEVQPSPVLRVTNDTDNVRESCSGVTLARRVREADACRS